MTLSTAIKPEIYISWIPKGKIGLRLLAFATIIPAPEKISADLLRKVSNNDTAHADLFRQLKNSEKNSADTFRNIVSTEIVTADTKRKLFSEDTASADTFRRVAQDGGIYADIFRLVKDTEQVVADTSRKIGIAISRADLQRFVKVTEKSTFDTQRTVGGLEIFSADLYLKIVNGDTAAADTFRFVKDSETARADTLLNIGLSEKISADLQRNIAIHEKTAADTTLKTTSNETVQADLLRGLRDHVGADLLRTVIRSEKTLADTVIRIPHIWKHIIQSPPTLRALKKMPLLADSPDSPTSESLISSFKEYGITAMNINLNERTLSDEFRFDITVPVEIEDSVEGQFLDYPFRFLVEETTLKDLIQSVKGMYNQDEMLYTWFKMPYGDDSDDKTNDKYPKASAAIAEIAGDLGLTPNVQIDDFTPNNLTKGAFVTYADVLNNLFSWTSRVPQRQINVFIRGGTLHCIQRGKEEKTFDISNIAHSRPSVNKKFNRVLCHNPNNDSDSDSDSDNDETKKPFTGTIFYTTAECHMKYFYKNGLLLTEDISYVSKDKQTKDIIKHSTHKKYTYTTNRDLQSLSTDTETTYYIKSKTERTISEETNFDGSFFTEINSSTKYHYKLTKNDIYLFFEHEETIESEYSKLSSRYAENLNKDEIIGTQIRETYHVPVGNGWYAQTVYVDGLLQGANLSQGKPGNAVSQYTIDQVQQNFNSIEPRIIDDKDDSNFNDQLQAIVDDSFPVRENDFIAQLNEDLRWLHRKTVETVTVDLISKVVNGIPELQHIVDFTETVTLDNATYFLVSNNISFTPRKLIQKLQLIRWY